MYIYPKHPTKKYKSKLLANFFLKLTVKRGLKPRPTAKFADQFTSTAILEAGTRYA